MKSLGIIGGTFDPITLGHMHMAQLCLTKVDEVCYMPCYKHTEKEPVATAEQRMDMCWLAAMQQPNVWVSSHEYSQKHTGETLPSLRVFQKKYENKYRLYFVIGQDVAGQLKSWGENVALEISKIVDFLVIGRPGYPDLLWYHEWPHIFVPNNAKDDITSTDVRKGNFDAVHPAVLEYIRKNNIYV